jgi:hypothetical protein
MRAKNEAQWCLILWVVSICESTLPCRLNQSYSSASLTLATCCKVATTNVLPQEQGKDVVCGSNVERLQAQAREELVVLHEAGLGDLIEEGLPRIQYSCHG